MEIPLIGWLERAVDRWFEARAATRRFEAEQIDQMVRVLGWSTERCIDLLENRPNSGAPDPGDSTYADAASIGNDAAVGRLIALHDEVVTMGRSGTLATLDDAARATMRLELLQAMEAVRAAASKRRRRYGKVR